MWYKNLLEIYRDYEKSGGNRHTLADKANLPYDTVKRVISGATANPTLDTLDRLATALNCTLGDVIAGTRAVVGDKTLAEVQEQLDTMTAVKESIEAERDLSNAENTLLKDEVKTLNQKIELLTMQLAYKDEIIALYKIIEAKANT